MQRLTMYQANTICEGKTDGLVYGDYVILDRIGAGGMGQVFKAHHRRMKRIVALKILPAEAVASPNAVERFEREVEAAARLLHPNIVTAFDAGEANGVHYLIVECVDGSDLSSLVKEKGPVSVAKAVDYIKQAATGLAFAHGKGVVHRDIKPANLLLDREGTVKILDVGLARLEKPANGNGIAITQAELTQDGSVLGTVDYMSPEQALDTKNADARADIYSLGCTLYYLLTGAPVFIGNTLMARMLAHREADIPSLVDARPDVPDEVDAVFKKMVAKEPEERYQSGTELLTNLERIEVADEDDVQQETAVAAETYVDSVSKETSSAQLDETLDLTPRPEESREGEAPAEPCLPVVSARQEPRPPSSETVSKKSTASEGHRTDPKTSSTRHGIPIRRIVAVAALFGGSLLAAVLLKISTPHGTVLIEIGGSEQQRKVTVTEDGTIKIEDPNDGKEVLVTVDAENKTLTLSKEGFEIQMKSFNLKSKDGRYVKVTFVPVEELASGGTVDREVAQKVIAAGGTVGVSVHGGRPIEIAKAEDLPGGEFDVVDVFYSNPETRSDDLEFLDDVSLLRKLPALHLGYTPISEKGLQLQQTQVTGSGFAPLGTLENLKRLYLQRSKLDDVGATHISELTGLEYLHLNETAVTAEGVARLKEALPNCEIIWDGNATDDTTSSTEMEPGDVGSDPLDPKADDPDREVAKWVLRNGGYVSILEAEQSSRTVRPDEQLPADSFHVTAIGLSSPKLTGDAFRSVCRLSHLKGLVAEHCPIMNADLVHIAEVEGLEYLNLKHTPVTDLAPIATLSNLEELLLSAEVGDADELRDLARLKHLQAAGSEITDAGLSNISKLPELETLNLGSNKMTDAGIQHLTSLPKLDHLTLAGELISDVGLQKTAQIQTLRHLHFHNAQITDKGLVHLAQLDQLESLYLVKCQISNAGLSHIVRLDNLTGLDLGSNRIAGDGIRHLANLVHLETLSLISTDITDADLEQLATMKALELLQVGGTNVTAEGVAKLQKALPDCRINWSPNATDDDAAED